MTVYIVAWEYGPDNAIQGGGFDWYWTEKEADKAFAVEQINERELNDENWKAYKFSQEFSDSVDNDAITKHINNVLVETIEKIKKGN